MSELTIDQLKTTYETISRLHITDSVRKKVQEQLILEMAKAQNLQLFGDNENA